jgi:hypothetical protein
MNYSIDDFVTVSPPVWPGKELHVQPGDLTRFAPMGFGLGMPLTLMPGKDLASAAAAADYYSYHVHSTHPFLGAPPTEPTGGTVYFDSDCKKPDVEAVLRLLHVRCDSKAYAVFAQNSSNPRKDRYLTQVRIVSEFALQGMFRALSWDEKITPEQDLTIGGLIWQFIRLQHQVWGSGYNRTLEGLFGGDGDDARERLAFGFTLENEYYGVYRVWSRAWLVTK